MQENSIAQSIVQIADAKAREQGARAIQLIGLRVGALTSIAEEALQVAFDAAREGTLAQDAKLDIELVPTVVYCVVCRSSAQPVLSVRRLCEQCFFPLKVVAGEELQIAYIDVTA